MQQNVIVSTPSQLAQLIDEAVFNALQKTKFTQSKAEPRPEISDFLNVAEAAGYLRIAKQTLYQMTSNRQIAHFKTGSRLVFSKADLIEYLNKNKKNFKNGN